MSGPIVNSDASARDKAPATPPSPKRSSLRATLVVSAATLGSRILGLVREQLFAALLGAGLYADAFVVAFRIPNLLRDLFAEGALSAAFVPTFTRVEKEHGKEAAFLLANRVVGAITVFVGAIAALAMILSEPLVAAMASGFTQVPGKAELTARLARLMMPFLPLLSLSAVTMGMLNARGRFGAPALAPALFNVAAIVVGGALKLAGADPETAVVGWSLGTLAGGALQLGVQLPPLRREGYRFRPAIGGAFRDESVRKIAVLMAPATLGLAATQLNIFVNTQFASTEPGANAWLNYAFRLMYLPIGVFGVAIATVTSSTLARRAAENDVAGMKSGLGVGLRHVALLTVPSTVGLLVLREPIIGLIYERGSFSAEDTGATAIALAGYAVGLYAYSGVKVLAPAFYALGRPRIPLVASGCAVLSNLLLNFAAHRHLGYLGLALGTSLGALLNMAILALSFGAVTREVPWPPGLVSQAVRVIVAAALMGVAVHATLAGIDAVAHEEVRLTGFAMNLLRTSVGIAVGALAYAGVCRLLRVEELGEILDAIRRRRLPSPADGEPRRG
jgi:putative peptidoglycan lipid II flippase